MVGAICDQNHWTLTAMYPQQRRSLYLDPFGAPSDAIKKCSAVTRAFMRQRGLNCSRWSSDSPTVHVEGPFDEEKMRRLRMQTAKKLVTETDDLSELCQICDQSDSHEQWIECTLCSVWFHWDCVGQPPVEGDYFCPVCPRRNGKGTTHMSYMTTHGKRRLLKMTNLQHLEHSKRK
ncbi:uncharacterized protein AKAME5_001923300, partial [Lates japonicus]